MARSFSSPAALVGAAASGVLFGIGLSVSQMTHPEKIWNFLDLAAIPSGGWDPSLAFVMGGGVVVAFIGLRLDRWLGWSRPAVGPSFIVTHRTKVDAPLLIGSAVFGIGWGLSGFCPGPAIADLGLVPQDVWLFVVAMVAGSWIAGAFLEWGERAPAATAQETTRA
jgi:uncharacterized membrane protein YedE/YeeE